MMTRQDGSSASRIRADVELSLFSQFGVNTTNNCQSGMPLKKPTPSQDFLAEIGNRQFGTILADPPWRFQNRTGKVAPEHRRLSRYGTLSIQEIMELPIPMVAAKQSHLYLWVPNALLDEGLAVMKAWGFKYKTNIVWHKVRKDGGPDGRGVGFYFRNTTEIVLFGIRGNIRTLKPGRRQVNIIRSQKREHSRKPDELYEIIQACSPGPYLELFARGERERWVQWGNQVEDYLPSWPTYANHSQKKSQQVVADIHELKPFKEKSKPRRLKRALASRF